MAERVAIQVAGRGWSLPSDSVLDIGLAGPVAPIPFASDTYEGIVFAEDGPVARVDLGLAQGGPARNGHYAATVRTAVGPVSLRVDSVSLDGGGDLPDGMAAIAAATTGLTTAAVGQVTAREPEAARRGAVLVRAAGRRLALFADSVLRAERHDGAWRPLTAAPGERVVLIGGEPVAGHSLPVWLGGAEDGGESAADSAGWALLIRDGDDAFALTIDDLCGLIELPASEIRFLPQSAGWSAWIPDRDAVGGRGFVQVLNPTRAGLTAFPRNEGAAAGRVGDPEERGEGGGTLLSLGPFRCVLPAADVLDVRCRAGAERLAHRRGPGRLPAFDAAALLGLPPSGPDPVYAAIIGRPGRRDAALLASALEPCPARWDWHPLPAVPAAVGALFRSVRPSGEAVDLLMHEDAPRRAWRTAAAGAAANALAGWLEKD